MKLPQKGNRREEVLAAMQSMRERDANWKKGVGTHVQAILSDLASSAADVHASGAKLDSLDRT